MPCFLAAVARARHVGGEHARSAGLFFSFASFRIYGQKRIRRTVTHTGLLTVDDGGHDYHGGGGGSGGMVLVLDNTLNISVSYDILKSDPNLLFLYLCVSSFHEIS